MTCPNCESTRRDCDSACRAMLYLTIGLSAIAVVLTVVVGMAAWL